MNSELENKIRSIFSQLEKLQPDVLWRCSLYDNIEINQQLFEEHFYTKEYSEKEIKIMHPSEYNITYQDITDSMNEK
jgi:hypothetical protein